MIDKANFHILNFIKKEEFTGSMSGMRYMLKKNEEDGKAILSVIIWPEPFCYGKTPDEKKQSMEFTFDEQGLDEAADWLNEQYIQQKPLWDLAASG